MSAIPTSKVNMSLDDIIKQSKKDRKKPNSRRNFGERRRFNGRQRNFDKKINLNKEGQSVEKRTRLFVSNLQKELVNSELRVS